MFESDDPYERLSRLRSLLEIKIYGSRTLRVIGDVTGANQCDVEAAEIRSQIQSLERIYEKSR